MIKIKLKTIEGNHKPHQERSKYSVSRDVVDETSIVIEHDETNDIRLSLIITVFINAKTIGWKIRTRICGLG
jgi:hypothetical protein